MKARSIAICTLWSIVLPALAISAHSAIGKGPSEPEAKQNAHYVAQQTYGDDIVSWDRENCQKKVEQVENRHTETGPYAVPSTPSTVYYVCEVEFTTKR